MSEFDHIKNSFEQNQDSVPDNVWDKIEQHFDSINVDLFHIKNSFDQVKDVAPDSVWENVQDQLDIDRSWHIISQKINEIGWSFLSRVAAVLALAFLLFTPNKVSNETQTLYGLGPTESKPVELLNSINPSELAFYSKQTTFTSIDESAFVNFLNESSQEVEKTHNGIEAESNSVIHSDVAVESIAENSSLGLGVSKSIYLSPEKLDSEIIVINSGDEYPTNKQPSKFSFGLIANINNTWILDNDTRQGFNSNSLIQNQISLKNAFGIYGNFSLTEKYSLETQLHFINSYSQFNNTYIRGEYTRKEVSFKTLKLSTTLQRNINNNYIGLGLFADLIYNKRESFNNVNFERNLSYSSLNWGTRIEFGKQIEVFDIPLSIGLNGELGLNNLSTLYSKYGRQLNPTRTVLFGAFVKFIIL